MVKGNALCLWNWNEEPDGGFLTDHKIGCLMIIFPLKRDYDKHKIYNQLV